MKKLLSLSLAVILLSISISTATATAPAPPPSSHPAGEICCGDVNQNSNRNTSDALEILKYLSGMSSVFNFSPERMDTAKYISRVNRKFADDGFRADLTGAQNLHIVSAVEILLNLGKMDSVFADCGGRGGERKGSSCRQCPTCGQWTGQFPACTCPGVRRHCRLLNLMNRGN